MTTVAEMLRTYPKDLGGVDREKLRDCIEACLDCAQTCTACADACLSEDMVAELTKCIRTCTDCSDVCDTTFRVLSRHTGYDANLTRAVLEACVAPSTPRCTSTAGSAPIRAVAARPPAESCSPASADPVCRDGAGTASPFFGPSAVRGARRRAQSAGFTSARPAVTDAAQRSLGCRNPNRSSSRGHHPLH